MTHELATALSPKTFLEKCLQLRKEKGLPHSYAYVARVAGFAARSFPRDVVKGEKTLTPQSALAIANGLKLGADFRDLFVALVEYELAQNTNEKARCEKKISTIRGRIERKQNSQDESAFAIEHFSAVYASLGAPRVGATLAEIQLRSGLPYQTLRCCLEELKKLELVQAVGDRFVAKANHLAFSQMKKDGAFHSLYLSRMREAEKRSKLQFNSADMLFQESTFSVRPEKLPQLKLELRSLLQRFVDDSEDPEGVTLACAVVAFFPLKKT